MKSMLISGAVAALALLAVACGSTASDSTDAATSRTSPAATTADPEPQGAGFDYAALRDPDVPDLPFADNPDPNQCGIPVQWGPGGQAFLSGLWEGELIQPEVLLYDSHQRLGITGSADHGAEVVIVLYQENPVLDYYFVEVVGQGDKGWIPDHFLSFEPVV